MIAASSSLTFIGCMNLDFFSFAIGILLRIKDTFISIPDGNWGRAFDAAVSHFLEIGKSPLGNTRASNDMLYRSRDLIVKKNRSVLLSFCLTISPLVENPAGIIEVFCYEHWICF